MILAPYRYVSGITDPTDIAGLECWYDCTDINSLYQTNSTLTPVTATGQNVGYIADLSGNGYNLLQPSIGLRPSYETGGILFNGLSNHLFDSTARNSTPLTGTVFIVFNQASGGDGTLWCNSSASSTVIYSIHVPNHDNAAVGSYATLRTRTSGADYVATLYSEDQTHDDNNNHVQTAQISNGDNELWIDGVSYVTNTAFISEAVNLNRFCMGALIRTSVADYFAGYVLEVVYYTSVLSDTDRQAVESYLTTKHSI